MIYKLFKYIHSLKLYYLYYIIYYNKLLVVQV